MDPASWHWDTGAAAVIVAASVAYGWGWWRAGEPTRRYGWWFVVGVVLIAVATMSMVGAYATVLFWVRALQVLLLLYVAPFFVAMGRPVTVLGLQRWPTTRAARLLAHPATTSLAMLATPWLLYLTPWYTAALQHEAVASATNALLLVIGFAYYYARLQADPVPRRYTQLISLVISIVESLGDGLLGIVLWLGPLVAVDYYAHVDRHWGPSQRVDQSIGAGVLWLLGDVLGVGFIVVLMRYFAADENRRAAVVDAELDDAQAQPVSGLWWENDPQLRERMHRA